MTKSDNGEHYRAAFTVRMARDKGDQLKKLAAASNVDVSTLIGTLIESELSGASTDSVIATLVKRLDHQSRQIGRLTAMTEIISETIASFVLQYLSTSPSLPEDQLRTAARAGKARFDAFADRVANNLRRYDTFVELQLKKFEAHDEDYNDENGDEK